MSSWINLRQSHAVIELDAALPVWHEGRAQMEWVWASIMNLCHKSTHACTSTRSYQNMAHNYQYTAHNYQYTAHYCTCTLQIRSAHNKQHRDKHNYHCRVTHAHLAMERFTHLTMQRYTQLAMQWYTHLAMQSREHTTTRDATSNGSTHGCNKCGQDFPIPS